ncbi:MAG: hypothetical protein DRO95_05335 [Candidatus Altiarchaeales archaeon]|nr:MAG: hypothetical protein DRO95_05335 [Candidatus Altiarchaeales archaeon]
MAEIVVRIPDGFEFDEKELSKSLEDFIRLKLARDIILVRLDELLHNSRLTEKECLDLGRQLKEKRFDWLKKKGVL